MSVRNYKELIAWQKAMNLVKEVYQVSSFFPKEELFGLTQQVRRAVVSIPSNIAEGQGRHSTKEFLHFLSIAHGSLQEVETQILIAQMLGYFDDVRTSQLIEMMSEVGRLLNGLSNSLKTKK